MLHLARPLYLLLLLLLPLAVWVSRRRGRPGVPHPSLGLLPAEAVHAAWWVRHGRLVMWIAGLTLLVLALARPRWPDLRTRLETEGIALMMVVDVSGSMAERDFLREGTAIGRLDAVKHVFGLFLAGGRKDRPDGRTVRFEGRATDLVGLVCFATRPETSCPLTLSHDALLRVLEAEQPRGVPGESETNLSDAVTLGLARLRAAGPRRKVLVLLTDGEHNQAQTRSGWSPTQTAHLAASLGVTLYTIDAGPPPAEGDDPASREQRLARTAAADGLRTMARLTGGRAFAAGDTVALADACRAIDRLERLPITSFQYRRYHEAYPWLALAAFLLFTLAATLDQTLWRRLP